MLPTLVSSLEITPLDLPLTEPFAIASGAQASAANVLVQIHLADGTSGLGEAAPLILVGAVTSGFSGGDPGDLTGDFTALPNIISNWSTRPASRWDGNTQAAILVTLALVLGINTIGIILSNRFDKKK